MVIGIDGNCWYCSNGKCLGDPMAEFTFERTLREAVEAYRKEFGRKGFIPNDMRQYLDKTPEQYQADHR